jgi:hypothetical protein
MKNLLAAMIAVSALFASNNAQARPLPPSLGSQCMAAASCTSTITADSGVTAKSCNAAANDCTCDEISWDYTGGRCWTISSICGLNYTNYGATASGQKCCIHNTNYCFSGGSEATVEEEVTSTNVGLEGVFSPGQTEIYFGYANGVIRSPNNGRATSLYARFDVCMGNLDADAALATNNATTCYNQYCGTSYNEYCRATVNNGGTTEAGGVCHDRCECMINGITHSSCNQL